MTSAPEEGGYGRVTAPERFRVLHNAGREAIEALTAGYWVDREDGSPADPAVRHLHGVERIVRLHPSQGAPLTIVFLAFPGLWVRAGYGHEAAFPACGGDACAERPGDVVHQFLRLVSAVVTGTLRESADVGWLGASWRRYAYGSRTTPEGERAGGERISRREARAMVRAIGRHRAWPAWVSREVPPP